MRACAMLMNSVKKLFAQPVVECLDGHSAFVRSGVMRIQCDLIGLFENALLASLVPLLLANMSG